MNDEEKAEAMNRFLELNQDISSLIELLTKAKETSYSEVTLEFWQSIEDSIPLNIMLLQAVQQGTKNMGDLVYDGEAKLTSMSGKEITITHEDL